MKNDVVIQARALGKQYSVARGGQRHNTLRDLLADGVSSLLAGQRARPSDVESFWALRNASFDVHRGENVGIVGLNGAGKSTLLKILSRITAPSTGMARIDGRLGALLEVGTGFHAELSGRENVYLYGAILGMGRAEISRKFRAIVDFAGIEAFIDIPLKRYSSGMYVRLAFSVAAHLEPDILILDEVLAVGDLSFQQKCINFAKELRRQNATILFVSHNMFSIKTMCSRVIYLRQGEIVFNGATEDGVRLYTEDCKLSTLALAENKPDEWPIKITHFELRDEEGRAKMVFDYGEIMRVRLCYEVRRPVTQPNFILAFIRSDGVACCNFSTETDGIQLGELGGRGELELRTPPIRLVAELYAIHVLVRDVGFQMVHCAQIGATFHVRHKLFDPQFGVFHEQGEWSVDSGGSAGCVIVAPSMGVDSWSLTSTPVDDMVLDEEIGR